MAAGESHGMEFSSTRALTIRRIEGGILGNTTDMDASMTPFEAGLGAFVDLEKGDFIGRDALVDADRRPLAFRADLRVGNTVLRQRDIGW